MGIDVDLEIVTKEILDDKQKVEYVRCTNRSINRDIPTRPVLSDDDSSIFALSFSLTVTAVISVLTYNLSNTPLLLYTTDCNALC